MKKTLFILLSVGFLLFGVSAFMQSRPTPKNARIYKIVQEYSPYYMEKRFGGLQIRSKTDENFKEKPDNMELFHRFEFLEKQWGQKHLNLKDHALIIRDDTGTALQSIPLKEEKEYTFVHSYYGI